MELLYDIREAVQAVHDLFLTAFEFLQSLFGHHRQQFVYKPLKAGEIRLLTFRPGRHGPLRCSVRHVPADGSVRYPAISYVWGSSDLNREVIIEGKRLAITTNAHAALRALKSYRWIEASGPAEAVSLWIDSISINQNDLDEKSRQVQMMGSIYKDAENVLIWLGNEQDDSSLALRTLSALSKRHEASWDVDLWASLDTERCPDGKAATFLAGVLPCFAIHKFHPASHRTIREMRHALRPMMRRSRALGAILQLCQRVWWRRLWVVQELLMHTNRDAFTITGRTVMPARDWSDGMITFSRILRLIGLQKEYEQSFSAIRFNQTWRRWVDFSQGQEPTYGDEEGFGRFLGFLDDTIMNGCSDERDRIYALASLMPERLALLNPPDYRMSFPEVLLRFARTWIQLTGNLDIINCFDWCSRSNTTRDLTPSWAPIPAERERSTLIKRTIGYGGSVFTAGGRNVIADPFDSAHPTKITLAGFHVDSFNQKRWLLSLEDSAHLLVERHWYEAALAAGCDVSQFWHLISSLHPFRFDNKTAHDESIRILAMELQQELLDESDEEQAWMRIADILQQDYDAGVHHRFVISEGGRMCLIPHRARVDDLICVLYGGQTPYLLRHEIKGGEKGYIIVGECYVDGLMNGEALVGGQHEQRNFIVV